MNKNSLPPALLPFQFKPNESVSKKECEAARAHNRERGAAWCKKMGKRSMVEVEEAFKKGRKRALLDAVFLCAFYSLPLPKWCEKELCEAFFRVLNFEACSWDDLFGSLYPKGTKVSAQKGREDKAISVYLRVLDIRKRAPEIAIDDGFFEEVGREFGISGSLANKFYYRMKGLLKLIDS